MGHLGSILGVLIVEFRLARGLQGRVTGIVRDAQDDLLERIKIVPTVHKRLLVETQHDFVWGGDGGATTFYFKLYGGAPRGMRREPGAVDSPQERDDGGTRPLQIYKWNNISKSKESRLVHDDEKITTKRKKECGQAPRSDLLKQEQWTFLLDYRTRVFEKERCSPRQKYR